jgi:DNA-binding IclR family transcriptional regulator
VSREPAGGTQSVERALGLLQAFSHDRPELRVTELAQLSGLGQSTVSRLLSTLEALGYVERDDRSGLYRLGLDLVTLAGIALNQSPVHREARQTAQSLACSLALGANVAERRDAQLFYLLNFDGRLAPRSYTLVGRRGPLHATGMGKALICELGRGELERLLPERSLHRFTHNTHIRLDTLATELALVRERGYALEVEELALGRACVAAPIRDRSGSVVAALSISGPLSALALEEREAELASRAIESADQISIGLGYLAALTAAS